MKRARFDFTETCLTKSDFGLVAYEMINIIFVTLRKTPLVWALKQGVLLVLADQGEPKLLASLRDVDDPLQRRAGF